MTYLQGLYPLRGVFQNYSWGESSSESLIRRLWGNDPNLPETGPIAEVWFGNHANGRSEVFVNESWIKLDQFLSNSNSPSPKFLAKILCIEKVLSIQLHPSQDQAGVLNANFPDLFPDQNSKPEMAIALSDIKLLCGVRNLPEISKLIECHQAFSSLSKFDLKSELQQGIPKLFEKVFNLEKRQISEFSNAVIDANIDSEHDILARKIIETGDSLDSGIIALYFLDFLNVPKGNAIYIKPGIPHAYLEGTLFECMKNSDNVVRGGLTNKPIDTKNFCELVDVEPYAASFKPKTNTLGRSEDSLSIFENADLPFTLELYKSIDSSFKIQSSNKNEVIVVIQGSGEIRELDENVSENNLIKFKPGSCFFSNQHETLEVGGKDVMLIRVTDLI